MAAEKVQTNSVSVGKKACILAWIFTDSVNRVLGHQTRKLYMLNLSIKGYIHSQTVFT